MYSATNHVPFPQGGVLLLSSEHSEGLLSRFGPVAERENHHLIPIEFGTLNQLRNLVHLVSTGEVSCGFEHLLCDVYSAREESHVKYVCLAEMFDYTTQAVFTVFFVRVLASIFY